VSLKWHCVCLKRVRQKPREWLAWQRLLMILEAKGTSNIKEVVHPVNFAVGLDISQISFY